MKLHPDDVSDVVEADDLPEIDWEQENNEDSFPGDNSDDPMDDSEE